MKKLIACLLGGLMLLTVAVTPVAGTEIISKKKNIILIDEFYTGDLVELLQATVDLKKGDTLHLYSQGPGGSAVVATSMMNYLETLKMRGIKIITTVTGMAASANALIWMIGDERIVHEGDLLMFHEPIVRGNYGIVLTLDDMTPAQAKIHMNFCHYFRQKMLNILHDTELVNKIFDRTIDEDQNTNWFTGQEAFDLGLATKIIKTL